jgi:hypothetical protein
MTQPQNDSRALRNALGRFATGVTIVTAIDMDGHPIGLTVNSFSAVSLDPALVLWCLDNSSHNLAAFRKASHFAVNILAADQQEISNRFATWPADRFAGLVWQPAPAARHCFLVAAPRSKLPTKPIMLLAITPFSLVASNASPKRRISPRCCSMPGAMHRWLKNRKIEPAAVYA